MPSRLHRLIAVLAATALSFGLLSACTGKDAVDQNGSSAYQFTTATKAGKLIPPIDRKTTIDLSATLLSGGSYSLASDAGKIVVLNFWASWCGPCRDEMPQFESVYQAMKNNGVNFIGVDTKDSDPSGAEALLHKAGTTYTILSDEPGKVALKLGHIPAGSLPFTVILDKHRRVAGVYETRLLPADLTPMLTSLVAEA